MILSVGPASFSRRGLDGLAFLGLRGLGDCPAWAPYSTSGGGCSNVPAELAQATFSEFDDYGYTYAGGIAKETPQEAGAGSGAYGYGAGGGYQNSLSAAALEASLAEAEADARRAEQQGRALGLNVTCKTYQNTNPGGASLFGTDCMVNGQPGHDADLLNLPGGWNIAATSSQYAAGTPVQHLQLSTQSAPRYDFLDPNKQDTIEVTPIRTSVPPPVMSAPVTPTTQTVPAAVPVSNAVNNAANAQPPSVLQNFLASNPNLPVSKTLESASAATGLSTTTIMLLAAGAALFFLTRGK